MTMLKQGENGVTPHAAVDPYTPHAAVDPYTRMEQLAGEMAELRRRLSANPPPKTPVPPLAPVKLDLGCGNLLRRTTMKNWTREMGWTGVDIEASDGADVVCDLGKDRWPWADSSVDEVNSHHMVEHIPGKDVEWVLENGNLRKVITYPRAHFFSELWRVLKPGAKATIVTPYWASARAYGDITHEWPPVCEWSWAYLDKEWRKVNAPHDSMYKCDFSNAVGYAPAQHLNGRNPEYVQEAIRDHKEAAGDMMTTLVARK